MPLGAILITTTLVVASLAAAATPTNHPPCSCCGGGKYHYEQKHHQGEDHHGEYDHGQSYGSVDEKNQYSVSCSNETGQIAAACHFTASRDGEKNPRQSELSLCDVVLGCIRGHGTVANRGAHSVLLVTGHDQSAFLPSIHNTQETNASATLVLSNDSAFVDSSLESSRSQKGTKDNSSPKQSPNSSSLQDKRAIINFSHDTEKLSSLETSICAPRDPNVNESNSTQHLDGPEDATCSDRQQEASKKLMLEGSIGNKLSIAALEQKFPMGTRVCVSAPSRNDKSTSRLSPVTVATSSLPVYDTKNQQDEFGSAVGWEDGIVVVHLDGNWETTKIPAEFCTVIDEQARWASSTSVMNPPKKKQKRERKKHAASKHKKASGKVNESGAKQTGTSPTRPGFEPATTIKEALCAGGWTPKRHKNHRVYSRPILGKHGNPCEMSITMAKTGSDYRGDRNTLARLNRFNRQHGTVDRPRGEYRHCRKCKQLKPKSDYTELQWMHKSLSKCLKCMGKR